MQSLLEHFLSPKQAIQSVVAAQPLIKLHNTPKLDRHVASTLRQTILWLPDTSLITL